MVPLWTVGMPSCCAASIAVPSGASWKRLFTWGRRRGCSCDRADLAYCYAPTDLDEGRSKCFEETDLDSKRALDLGLGLVGLVLTIPVLAVVAAGMRLSGDTGPFFYQSMRVGQGGTGTFKVLKIRTMAVGSGGSRITLANDPRVTRVGRVVRRYRLDELPQLVNVVRGEMSLVGPRPEDPAYVDLADPLHRRVFAAKPGITGLAQLAYHDEATLLDGPDADERYRREILPAKLKLDAEYLDRRTTLLDLQILLRTAGTVLR
jgi:lipopolysaccharide/colanic/teichoic acid biosynthesis glycosyltransferase